jgi:hypothetical protein|tara:strand:- start:19 stop:303 length:285 start_codon:yes stop_codon:yes gene_type:complete
MSKGLHSDSQIHISVAFLIKGAVIIAAIVGGWYQAQMKFAEYDRTLNDLHEEVVILNSKVAAMEKEHIEELEHHNEELIEQNKTLLQRLGIKKP